MQRSGAVMAWNVFRFCTALRGLGSVMILLVLGIVGITYYAVVVTNYGPAVFNSGGLESLLALAALLLFHLLLVMLLWSYFFVVLTDPGSVPSSWKPTVDEERGEETPINSLEFGNQILSFQQSANLADSGSPRIRFCRKCNQLKPPRCHHCSVCGRCVLKMDHHCVWVVNCVGALNYKFFLLFLIQEVQQQVYQRLRDSTVKYKDSVDKHCQGMNFNEGDNVLVYFRKKRFPIGSYSKLCKRKFGTFKIPRKLGANAYLIDLPPEVPTSLIFNISELYEYHGVHPSTINIGGLQFRIDIEAPSEGVHESSTCRGVYG